jgi:two-component system chemotaxis sensor kinase CheA
VRVRVDRLDRLINLAGELALGHQVQVAHVQTLAELQLALAQHDRALADLSAELGRLRFSPAQRQSLDNSLAALVSASGGVRATVRSQVERLSAHNDHHGLLVGDLEQEVMSARLLPVATVFANLPRAVRELSTSLGKEVVLTLNGETTELDRKLLEALSDPLTHLLRNALDHGIEPPHERAAQGKPAQGQLSVTASAVGNEVHVAVADDGRGMSPQALRDGAARKGLIGKDAAAALSDQEALELIFLPGFSTASMITDVSGRGVGMDVVRTNITELGGHVQLESQLGGGTTITLVLPLTLVTSRVLLVALAGQTYGLPASGCHGIIWTQPEQVETVEGHAVLRYENATVPLLRLADVLGVAGHASLEAGRRVATVLIGNAKRPLGVFVDRLDDEREVVVKPLGPLFERQRRYSGAVQLGDGRLVLLLNPVALAQEARGMARVSASPAAPARTARLLVADDSFTTRELIRSILQSAGYDVTAAIDGHDALDKLRAAPYDLVVSDVEMPRVTGFQLTARIRTELQLADLPVILVTSLASDDHKRQGLEAGAQAYIVKSQFNQDNLLEAIRQLLGR